MEPKLTIGTATFDDFDSVWFTFQSLKTHHGDQLKRANAELVIVDNNPDSEQGKATKEYCGDGSVRYVTFTDKKGSCPPRQHLFDVAKGKYVMCIDSHVLLAPGAIQCLLDYFESDPESNDLIHGPLLAGGSCERVAATHMIPQWRNQMFGTWATDEDGLVPKNKDGSWAEAFDIPQHGLGLFACRKEAWQGFHPDFDGFSGGEGYIHEKFRQAGHRVLCLPGLRWVHKFQRIRVPHDVRKGDKIRNHLIGWHSLGMSLKPIFDHHVEGKRCKDGKPVVSASEMNRLLKECNIPERCDTGSKRIIMGDHRLGSYGIRVKVLDGIEGDRKSTRERHRSFESYDVGYVVKSDPPTPLRRSVSKLIWDAMDCWWVSNERKRMEPEVFWAEMLKRFHFDEIVATSPACAETMSKLDRTVHLIPHAADDRVGTDWHNPDGPIVYAGMNLFIEPMKKALERAAGIIGKEIRFDHSHHAWKSLEGASLAICMRRPGCKLDDFCKPAIKVENAARAGIPVLSTNDPCITSMYSVPVVDTSRLDDAEFLAGCLRKAMDSLPPRQVTSTEKYVQQVKSILGVQ